MMKHRLTTLLAALILAISVGVSLGAEPLNAYNDMSWLDDFALVVLERTDVSGLYEARRAIHAHGGRVAIMSLPCYILGWIPPEIHSELIGQAGIRDVYFTDVTTAEAEASDIRSRFVVNFYNAVVRGEIQQEYFDRARASNGPQTWPADARDALERPQFDGKDYVRNLEAVGLDPRVLRDRGMLLQAAPEGVAGNSDRMAGTISITVFFVESDGSGSDPDMYTWTEQHMQDYVNGVGTGLAWWTAQSYNYFDCWNAFFVHFFPGTDPRCQQQYEPVLHGSGLSGSWITTVMGKFGYGSGDQFARVDAFNTWQRSTYETDWAYSAFIAYNPPPAADRFTNGVSAFAYLGGPYAVLLYRSYGWPVNQVFAHESGHIFFACDEYDGSGCSCTYCAGKPNNNCYVCSSGSCMMKANSFNLCAWTPVQIGWDGVGCAPNSLPTPTATGVSPSAEVQGFSRVITVTGTNFVEGATVELGAGVTVNSSTFVDPTTVSADITIDNDAVPGFVDVTVTNRDLQSATIIDGFEIKPSSRHYVASTGSNVFPYVTPADAATTIASALAAAGDGDSVLVESMTIGSVSLSIVKPLELYGGWDGSFTTRDPVSGKTVLNMTGNITVNDGPTVLDGFEIRNGSGTFQTLPIPGYYGGGVRILGTSATVSNCDIESNTASTGGSFGAGGGIYGEQSTVFIDYCLISSNVAGRGAGVCLDQCSGGLSNSTISANQLSYQLEPPRGAGVYLKDSPGFSFTDNTIADNVADDGSGAQPSGGGLYIHGSSFVSLTGGAVSGNTAEFGGGGLKIASSDVTLQGTVFLGNDAAFFGGAISCDDSSSLSLSECGLSSNTSFIGAGLYVSAGSEAFINHCLFVGNIAASSGGACYFTGVGDGSFIGNTLDGNGATNTGGVIFSNSPMVVFNNIVANSGDVGVSCSGAALPSLSYNNVWNSVSSDYSGCTPGAGELSADPLFVDPVSTDYHLGLHSPSIDAGNPDQAYQDPDGSRGDMGYYGSHPMVMDQPVFPKNVTAVLQSGDVVLSWDTNPESDLASYAVYKDSMESFVPSVENFVQLVAAPDTSVNLGAPVDSCFFKVSAVDTDGYAGGYSAAAPTPTGISGDENPLRFVLYQNHPNPFNPTTQIRYELARRVSVDLTVFDVRGHLLRRLVGVDQGPGVFVAEWDGTNQSGDSVASGIYFYRLVAGPHVQTKKMVMLK